MATLAVPLYDDEKVDTPSTVCVTGATGFLAGAIIERLLASGHTVRATVRDVSKTATVSHLLELPGASDRLKFFSADLLKAGTFDEAVSGCDYVIHAASPFIANIPSGKERELVIDPAVKGVEHVFDAVNKAPSVKRVIQTSSVAAILGVGSERGEDHLFTEEDWNQTSTETFNAYSYSKKLAEQRAWELAKQQDRWKLVVINPSLIYGPPPSARQESESVKIMAGLLNGLMWPAAPPMGFGWVDIRDVAAAHTLAMLHPNAEGRYICSEETYTLLQMGGFVGALFPGKYRLPKCTAPAWLVGLLAPLMGYDRKLMKANMKSYPYMDHSKIERELGFKFTPRTTTINDMVNRLAALQLVSKP